MKLINGQKISRRLETAGSPPGTLASDQERVEAVWRRRAARLALRPESAGAGQNVMPVLVVAVGDERYGIELAEVAEILPPMHVTPVPGAPAVISGVINVHGEIRAVIDLRRLLSIEAVENGSLARVVLLRKQGRELGLKVDRVERIRGIAAGELQSSRDGAAHLSAPCLKGLTKDMLMLIGTSELLEELDKGSR